MKIAYILSHINKSLQWQWFSEELLRRNVDHFYIIIDRLDPMLVRDLQDMGIKVYYLKHRSFFSYFSNLYRITRILKKEKPNIVHTSLPFGNFLGQLGALLAGIRNRITTCENASWPHDFKSTKQEIIDRVTYWSAQKVIATCDAAYEYLAIKWKIRHHKLSLIYQGLKLEDFEDVTQERIDRVRKQLNILPGDFVLGMIARFEYWKGHIYVIEAMRKIVPLYPEIKLYIFGAKGPEFDSINAKIQEYQLTQHVLYKGFISDPVALFNLFDIHVHVPINKYVETFGINIIEGMAAARPQILTRSGIAFTTAQHLYNSWVVDYCKPDQIAQAVIALKEDRVMRERLAKQAKTDVVALFSNERKANQCLQLYDQLNNQ